ncbi:MAG: adenylate/guanylate cyclase domain-containing protein [Candidatus Nitrosotenuis sp.]
MRGLPVTLDKKLVTLVILVSLVGIGITITLSFHYATIIVEERIADHLNSESAIRGDSIKNTLSSKVQQIQVISTDPMIRKLISELNVIDNDEEFARKVTEKRIDFLIQIQAFESSIGGANDLENVEIVSKDGKRLFALVNTKSKKDFLADHAFNLGINKPFIEVTYENGKRLLVAATPIYENPKDQKASGVAIVTMNTQSIDQILLNRLGLGNTGESYIVNEERLLVSESRFIENAAFNQQVNTYPVELCFSSGKNHYGLYDDYRGIQVLGSSNCMSDLGLILLVEIDDKEVFQPIITLRQNIIMLGITITVAVAIAAYFLSKLISKPLIKLKNAANVLADGNFDIRTDIRTNDEIGQLSRAFDQMAEKIQDSLLKIKEREDVIRQQKEVLLQFSQFSSNYCVCFVDIVGSTKLTAKLSDLQTSKFYSIFLNSLATVITQNGGVVVKNIGDALLYYFPKTDTDEAGPFAEMLRCNMKVIEARSMINELLRKEELPELSYRISANYGPVRVAIIATSSIDDIFGTTVNTCSKINSLAKPNTLIIGQPLYEKVKKIEQYRFEKVTSYDIDVENKLDVYSVTPKQD